MFSFAPVLLLPILSIAQPIVDLGYAQYEGVFDSDANATHFFGIRYAAPPIDSLRWQAPQAPSSVTGIQSADAHPQSCPQGSPGTSPIPALLLNLPPEDCLFLDVYIPSVLGNVSNLPVLVWIHGGAWIFGNAAMYTGGDIIRESNGNVILVVIQYRLGLFGFLAGEKVKEGGVLNAGLLDQQFALKWVHDHIAKFGGDPSRVTIWGESAGGASSLYHIIANDGQTNPPLFHNAMSSSTYLVPQYQYNASIPESLYQQVVAQTDCASSSDTLECLRAADSTILQSANANISASQFFGTVAFVPVVDGTFITQRPSLALKQGKFNGNGILLVVNNVLEGAVFVNETIADTLDLSTYISNVFPLLDGGQIAQATQIYSREGSSLDQVITMMGESIIICPTYMFVNAFPGRAFKGEFALPPARHLDDIVYYFPSMNGTGAPPGIPPAPIFNNTAFLKAFSQAFMDIVVFSNVNEKIANDVTPEWPYYDEIGRIEMVFNRTEDGQQPLVKTATTSLELLERCSFWESVNVEIGQ